MLLCREAVALRKAFPEYFARITNVLQEVPRELVLLIKTNDLVSLLLWYHSICMHPGFELQKITLTHWPLLPS